MNIHEWAKEAREYLLKEERYDRVFYPSKHAKLLATYPENESEDVKTLLDDAIAWIVNNMTCDIPADELEEANRLITRAAEMDGK